MDRKKLNWTLNGLVALSLSFAPCVFAQVMDGTSEPSKIESQLTLEDLETLLRSPKSHDEALAGHRLSQLSPAARKQLLAKVSLLKKEKEEKIRNIETKSKTLKAKLREERKSIQQERMSTYGRMDDKAKMQLFSNLLDEANLDANQEGDVREISSEYLVTITSEPVEKSKSLQSIAISKKNLWTPYNDRQVAQN